MGVVVVVGMGVLGVQKIGGLADSQVPYSLQVHILKETAVDTSI